MRQIWAMIGFGLLLLFAASAACCAAENAVKQLETAGSYEEALRSEGGQPPAVGYDTRMQADKLAHEFRMRQESNKLYEIAILSVLALVSLFIVLRFITAKAVYSASHIVNATGLIFIIFGTILLVLMADTDEQLSAPIGILGAVAGYLFGSINRGKSGTETGEEK